MKGKAGVGLGDKSGRERGDNELSELGLIVLEIREELAHFAQIFTAWAGLRGVVVVLIEI